MKKIQLIVLCLSTALLSGCARLTLAWADLEPDGPPATPEALEGFGGQGPVASAAAWRSERAPVLRDAFEEYVYGRFPDDYGLTVVSRKVLDEEAFGGAGRLLEYALEAD
ncbi:MAG: hypothetical protein ACX939_01225, partial [Hyphococcus sp.]